jgi:hypothetical protein
MILHAFWLHPTLHHTIVTVLVDDMKEIYLLVTSGHGVFHENHRNDYLLLRLPRRDYIKMANGLVTKAERSDTAGMSLYKDSLYGNLYGISICYV